MENFVVCCSNQASRNVPISNELLTIGGHMMQCPQIIQLSLHLCTTFCCHDQYVGNSIILHTSINGGPCFDIRLLLFSHGCGTLAAILLIIVLAFMLSSSPFIATTFCPALGLSMALFMAVFTLDIAFFAFFLLLGISSKGFVLSLSTL